MSALQVSRDQKFCTLLIGRQNALSKWRGSKPRTLACSLIELLEHVEIKPLPPQSQSAPADTDSCPWLKPWQTQSGFRHKRANRPWSG